MPYLFEYPGDAFAVLPGQYGRPPAVDAPRAVVVHLPAPEVVAEDVGTPPQKPAVRVQDHFGHVVHQSRLGLPQRTNEFNKDILELK